MYVGQFYKVYIKICTHGCLSKALSPQQHVHTGLEPLLLDVQYRSHPGIAVFSSSTFYGGRVRSMVRPEDRPPPRGVPWLNPELPVLFVDVDGKERRPRGMGLLQAGGASAGGGSSFANAEEATVALEYDCTGCRCYCAIFTVFSTLLVLVGTWRWHCRVATCRAQQC